MLPLVWNFVTSMICVCYYNSNRFHFWGIQRGKFWPREALVSSFSTVVRAEMNSQSRTGRPNMMSPAGSSHKSCIQTSVCSPFKLTQGLRFKRLQRRRERGWNRGARSEGCHRRTRQQRHWRRQRRRQLPEEQAAQHRRRRLRDCAIPLVPPCQGQFTYYAVGWGGGTQQEGNGPIDLHW